MEKGESKKHYCLQYTHYTAIPRAEPQHKNSLNLNSQNRI